MCEFCTQHGEGKQWYLQMKNYSNELLHASLTPDQKEATGFDNRYDWVDNFIKWFTVPAYQGRFPEGPQADASASPTPPAPLNAEQRLARQKLRHFGQVIPIEEVEKVLRMADSIVRMPCGCRFIQTGLTDQRYCFGLGVDVHHLLGKYPDSAASLEVLGKAEAMKLINNLDEEGLMHSVWTGVTPYVIGVCNCDTDCGAYRSTIRERTGSVFFRAEYICQVDADQCSGCKECMRQCQFGAMFYSSAMGKVSIEPGHCYGCGVCRAACPQNAITLMPRAALPISANIWL